MFSLQEIHLRLGACRLFEVQLECLLKDIVQSLLLIYVSSSLSLKIHWKYR